MFRQTIRKISSINTKPIYSTKEYVDLYINNSKDIIRTQFGMQNKVLFGSVALLMGIIGWSVDRTDKRFEQVDKRFEQVDKRFEHLEKDIGEIKSILKEMNSKK